MDQSKVPEYIVIAEKVTAFVKQWIMLQRFWLNVGLPGLGSMVLQFSSLELCKQLGFFWLSFALLLLTGLGCLAAVL